MTAPTRPDEDPRPPTPYREAPAPEARRRVRAVTGRWADAMVVVVILVVLASLASWSGLVDRAAVWTLGFPLSR